MPPIYLIDEAQPNAFATGRNPTHAAVAVTSGILRMLDKRQLRAVLAHEISHVKNRDILIATIAAMLATTISYAANALKWGMIFGGMGGRDRDDRDSNGFAQLAMIILAPIMALIVQMAVSRQREFQADESGAHISHDPDALASALEAIEYGAQRIPNQTASPATASLYIMNPLFGGIGSGFARMFSTHPATAERVRRLRQMSHTVRAY
jgi:heat shock protein HtpX